MFEILKVSGSRGGEFPLYVVSSSLDQGSLLLTSVHTNAEYSQNPSGVCSDITGHYPRILPEKVGKKEASEIRGADDSGP